MDKLLLVLVSCLCALTCAQGQSMGEFCRDQGVKFTEAASRIGKTVTNGESVEVICRHLLKFTSIAYDTNVTCHSQLEMVRDSAMQASWAQIDSLIDNVCPAEMIPAEKECSHDVVNSLMTNCARTVNSVQPSSDSRDMCRMSDEYIVCLGHITHMCTGSNALMKADVYASLASARSTMAAFCPGQGTDTMQGDAPSGVAPPRPAAHEQCDVTVVSQEMQQCQSLLTSSMGNGVVSLSENCRAKHNFLLCADRIIQNCPVGSFTGVESVRTEYHDRCGSTYLRCPPNVLDRTHTAQGYCLSEIGNVWENTPSYCSKMTNLANCLTSLRAVCPVAHDNERQELDQTMLGVEEGLSRYC